jgi:hypothetical protein
MYWTKTVGGRSTRTVARRSVRSAAPSGLRAATVTSSASPGQSVKGCLVLLGVIGAIGITIATSGIALIPIAIGLIAWGIHRRRQPDQVAARLLKSATSLPPEQAVGIFHRAIDVDPNGSATTWTCANWFFNQGCWPDAVDAYAAYLSHPHQLAAELSYGQALLRSGHLDQAIDELQGVRDKAAMDEELQFKAIAEIAQAFYLKTDAGQGLAIASSAPLQRRNLTGGLQGCLLMRGVGRYLAGQRSQGISDLERLYAANAQSSLIEMKQQMTAGTFTLTPTPAYPSWYPAEVEETAQGAEGDSDLGQLSPDGALRWDGTAWLSTGSNIAGVDTNPVPPDQGAAGKGTAASPANNSQVPDSATETTSSQSFAAGASQTPPSASPVFQGATAPTAEVAESTLVATSGDDGAPAFAPIAAPEVSPPSEVSDANAPQFSPDRNWWWNGREWISTVSDDGRHRWDGARWTPTRRSQ